VANYPTSLDAITNPNPSTGLAALSHAGQHTLINDIIEAIEAKLGIGASTPGGTAGVLRRSASGESTWGQLLAGDYGAGSVGNADLAGGIALSKLAANPSATGMVPLSYGNTPPVYGQINGSYVAPDSLTAANLAANAVGSSELADGAVARYAQINNNIILPQHIAAGLSVTPGMDVNGNTLNAGVGWTYSGQYLPVSGMTAGVSRVLLIFNFSGYSNANNAAMAIGIGVENASSPTWYVYGSEPVGGNSQVMPMNLIVCWTTDAASHTFYGLVYNATGTMQRYGTSYLTALAINR
jgi:hypothetical protein